MFAKFAAMLKNKDIRKRILYTLLVLFVFRFGAAITVPGVDTAELIRGMSDNSLFAMLNLLGGGGLEQFSIFALGVTPYITASIIIQLLSMERAEGRRSERTKEDGPIYQISGSHPQLRPGVFHGVGLLHAV